ncbi:MAG: HisA/HisF-related TIM barrel protein, partial [Polaribacter sp.]
IFESWIAKYGSEKIILGADFYPDNSGGKIATNGWQEESSLELIPFITQYQKKGIQYVICTDISKDGMLQGPSFDIYKDILSEVKDLKLIASGGISTFDELPRLAENGCEGVIIGKAIYENKISLKQLENFIISQ